MLVADDSAINREVAIEALSRLGAQVETVDNGAEAVSAASRHMHDIIMMDGSMPQMDGFTAARIIRQEEESENRARVPIVALTAHVIGAAADEWRLAGMDAVIHKPFTIAQLAQCLVDQVPQFQTPADAPVEVNDEGPAEREDEARSSSPDREADVPLVDPGTLGQFRALNGTKSGGFLKRVVDLYFSHAPLACDQLRKHASAGEAEACGSVAHSLKSMSLNIGAVEVARIAGAIERLSRDDNKVPEHSLLDTLSNTMEQTFSVLANKIGEKYSDQRMVESGHASPSVIGQVDSLENDLCLAIERRELDVDYQPFVDQAGRAGARRRSPRSLEERRHAQCTSFGVRSDRRTERAYRRNGRMGVAARVAPMRAGGPELTVAVNVSPVQFRRPGLADRIEKILSQLAHRPSSYRA